MKKKALLIIDVQKSAVTREDIAKNIEKLQYQYEDVFVSQFINKNSPILNILDWNGYQDESLAFAPKENAVVYAKSGYSSYISEMNNYDEIHLCGFDTDACVYKTALDLIEKGIRPVILKDYCYSANAEMHEMGLKLIERNIGKHNILS